MKLSKSFLVRFQVVEHFRSFLVGRMFWSKINALLIISGGFGAFKKETVIKVGGYSPKTAGEDMDLVVKIHRYRDMISSPRYGAMRLVAMLSFLLRLQALFGYKKHLHVWDNITRQSFALPSVDQPSEPPANTPHR